MGFAPPRFSPVTTGAKNAEPVQKKGWDGALTAKRFLESTTMIDVHFDCYDSPAQCTLEMLDGTTQLFDLKGKFWASRNEVFVESKNHSGPNDQAQRFEEFLAHAYSSTVKRAKVVSTDPCYEYIWVTWHPFAQGKWTKLLTKQNMRDALAVHPALLGGEPVDDEFIDLLEGRIWLLVLHEKQSELMPDPAEIRIMCQALGRK